MLEVVKRLRQDKAALEVRLLGRLEELKKALDDMYIRAAGEGQTSQRFLCFWVQINRECAEKLELKHKI